VELKPFHKTFGKTTSSSEDLSGATRSYVFVIPPPKWKSQTAQGAAPDLELPDFVALFDRAPNGASLGADFEYLTNGL
jgi:hypothetical protein